MLGSAQMLVEQPEFHSSDEMRNLLELTERIGYEFENLEVLNRALVHSSMGNLGCSV